MRPAELCGGYCTGPSAGDVGGMPVDVAGEVTEIDAAADVDGVAGMAVVASARAAEAFSGEGVAVSSSATGEQVSGRAACVTCPCCCPPPLMLLPLPSRLHSRLEPLRSSFSDELVMVAD